MFGFGKKEEEPVYGVITDQEEVHDFITALLEDPDGMRDALFGDCEQEPPVEEDKPWWKLW